MFWVWIGLQRSPSGSGVGFASSYMSPLPETFLVILPLRSVWVMLVIDKDRWPRGWMQGQEATRGSCNSSIKAIRKWRPSEHQRPWTPQGSNASFCTSGSPTTVAVH